MGKTAGHLCFPAFDQFEHLLILRIFKLPDTVLTPMIFFTCLKCAEPIQIDGMALVGLENRSELVENNFYIGVAARCFWNAACAQGTGDCSIGRA